MNLTRGLANKEELAEGTQSHYELYFPHVGFFQFKTSSKDFDLIIKGILWGILRDFESTDNSSEQFTRGELLAWKVSLFYSRWHIPTSRLREFYAELVDGETRTPVKVFGIPNPYKAKKGKDHDC